MLSCSLKSNTEIFSLPPRILPKVFTLEAYQAILGNSTKVRFFLNSYLVASSVTLLTLFVAFCPATASAGTCSGSESH